MADVDLVQNYLSQILAIAEQSKADASASQEKVFNLQTEQADKLALRGELRSLAGEATQDAFHAGADYLMNWNKVMNSREEDKLRADLHLPDKKDFIAEQAKADLSQDLYSGMDYKTTADEAKESDQEAAKNDLDPNGYDQGTQDDTIDGDIEDWAKKNGI